jgi:hypothetical protein
MSYIRGRLQITGLKSMRQSGELLFKTFVETYTEPDVTRRGIRRERTSLKDANGLNVVLLSDCLSGCYQEDHEISS